MYKYIRNLRITIIVYSIGHSESRKATTLALRTGKRKGFSGNREVFFSEAGEHSPNRTQVPLSTLTAARLLLFHRGLDMGARTRDRSKRSAVRGTCVSDQSKCDSYDEAVRCRPGQVDVSYVSSSALCRPASDVPSSKRYGIALSQRSAALPARALQSVTVGDTLEMNLCPAHVSCEPTGASKSHGRADKLIDLVSSSSIDYTN